MIQAKQNIRELKTKLPFPFKHNDVVSFPDTESEYVDVGSDEYGPMMLQVAETEYPNLLIVHKCGRGFRFELYYGESEIFSRNKKRSKWISIREYIDWFVDYGDMKFVCNKYELVDNGY